MSGILVVGLNPAWQQVYSLPWLRLNHVHRAGSFWALASGKGLNAARILARLGHDVSLLQVIAGTNGRRVTDACESLGIRSLHARVAGETRVCTTLLGDSKSIEAVAPFSVADEGTSEALLDLLRPEDRYDALLICGTAPSGLAEGLYGRIAERVAAPHLIWDSVQGLTPEIVPRISWIKLNLAEYQGLAPVWRKAPKRPALVTNGSDGAFVYHHPSAGKCVPPGLRKPLNPIGAGDTATAMLADGVLRGLDARAAVARALAAATASCLHPLPAEWDPAEAERIEAEIRWEEEK